LISTTFTPAYVTLSGRFETLKTTLSSTVVDVSLFTYM